MSWYYCEKNISHRNVELYLKIRKQTLTNFAFLSILKLWKILNLSSSWGGEDFMYVFILCGCYKSQSIMKGKIFFHFLSIIYSLFSVCLWLLYVCQWLWKKVKILNLYSCANHLKIQTSFQTKWWLLQIIFVIADLKVTQSSMFLEVFKSIFSACLSLLWLSSGMVPSCGNRVK